MSSFTIPEATAIYQALLSWSESAKAAHMRERLQETVDYPVPIPQFQQAAVDLASSASSVKATGLLTQLVQDLPSLARVLLSVAMLVLGLMCCFVYVRGLRWGSQIGKAHGDSSSRPYFASGVSGLLGGMILTPAAALFLMLVVLSRRDPITSAPVSSNALLALICSTSVVGGLLSARSHYLGRATIGVVGGFATSAFIISAFQMTNSAFRLTFLIVPILLGFVLSCILAVPALWPRISSKSLCALSSLAGSWLLACAIDFHTQLGFIDLPGLFLTANGVPSYASTSEDQVLDWGTKQFRGLLAGMIIFSVISTGVQLWLYSRVGEDPDAAWNGYLHRLIDEEKSMNRSVNGRNGVFEPKQSFWTKLFDSNDKQMPSHAAGEEQSPLTEMPPRFGRSPRPDNEGFEGYYDPGVPHRPTSLASYASSATLVSSYQKDKKVDFDATSDSDLHESVLPALRNTQAIATPGKFAVVRSIFSSSAKQPARYQPGGPRNQSTDIDDDASSNTTGPQPCSPALPAHTGIVSPALPPARSDSLKAHLFQLKRRLVSSMR